MRFFRKFWLLAAGVFACVTASAATLSSTTQELSGGLFRIQYQIDFDLLLNQELEIEFDADTYLRLHSAYASDDFDVLLFQPNDPTGTNGRLSALALVDHPHISYGIVVDVELLPAVRSQGAERFFSERQRFAINQLDDQSVIIASIASGLVAITVPEPATGQTTTVILLGTCLFLVCRQGIQRPVRKEN